MHMIPAYVKPCVWPLCLKGAIETNLPFNGFFSCSPEQCDEVSTRSLLLCCDLLAAVCRAALQFCPDALECHLQVILGTLTAQVTSRPAISQQVRNHAWSETYFRHCSSFKVFQLKNMMLGELIYT